MAPSGKHGTSKTIVKLAALDSEETKEISFFSNELVICTLQAIVSPSEIMELRYLN